MIQAPACQEFEEKAFAERYLTNRLSPVEQEEFEAHFLTCDRCQQAISLGAAIRSTFPRVRGARSRRPWVLGGGLGLAAAAGLAAILLLPARRTSEELARLGDVTQAPIYLGVPVRAGAPGKADSLFESAMAAYQAGRYAEAIAGLRAALAAGVDSAPAQFFLASSLLLTGQPAEAAADFARVIALGDTPYRAEAHFYRAKALLRLDQAPEALAALRHAAEVGGVIGSYARALADSVERIPQR